jgi:hypothetical protein
MSDVGATGPSGRFAMIPEKLFSLRCNDGSLLDAVDQAMFVAIAIHGDPDRFGFPSTKTLAKMIRRKQRTAIKCLRRLEESGAITSHARFDETGRQTSNGYVLALTKSELPDAAQCTPEDAAQCTPEDAAQCTPITDTNLTDTKEHKKVGAASASPGGNVLVLFKNEKIPKTANGRRITFRQANAAGELKLQCSEFARRKFIEHDWPAIDWDLVWEEFSQYWGVEVPRKTKVDWPATFYHRTTVLRTWSAYQIGGKHHAGRRSNPSENLIQAAGELVRECTAVDAAGGHRSNKRDHGP